MSDEQERIFTAAAAGKVELVSELCAAEPKLAQAWRDDDLATPLHSAVGHPEVVEALLAAGADPDMINSDEERLTPLHLAARAGALETLRRMLAHGADMNAHSHLGTPLHLAVTGRHGVLPPTWREVVEALLDAGAEINAVVDPDTDCWTPLHQACNEGYLEAVDFLLSRGAQVDLEKDGLTPLLIAEANDFEDIAASLKAAGAR